MKKISRIIALLFAATIALTMFGCGGKKGGNSVDLSGAPDYSGSTGEFLTYGYTGPTDGTWFRDDEQYNTGEDYRTTERYAEYKDAGFNVLLLQGNEPYNGEPFETSILKRTMDRAYEAGIKKVIVYDSRIFNLSASEVPIVGEGRKFATEDDLVEFIRTCLADYKDHPAFFGVMLVDEPFYDVLPQAALTYKACEKALDGIYVQLNLLPLDNTASSGRFQDPDGEFASLNVYDQYELYLRQFCEWSGCDRICMDSYPIRQYTKSGVASEYYILDTHLRNLRILNKVAKEFNCKLDAVAQTMGMGQLSGDTVYLKSPDRSEMYWQMNAYMGFGIKTFASFTYWNKQQNSVNNEFYDGSAYITRKGERTPLYYSMQKIHREMQEFAPVLLNFDYCGMRYYYTKPSSYSTLHLSSAFGADEEQDKFSELSDVKVGTSQMAMVTELKDENSGRYMYMLMNPQAPSNAKFSDVSLNATLDFGSKYKAVKIWYKGESKLAPLVNGKIDFDLSAGYAVFVMPY